MHPIATNFKKALLNLLARCKIHHNNPMKTIPPLPSATTQQTIPYIWYLATVLLVS
ncbi:hypothetical protein II941_03965 [bacterium]|nr:hypothetical protein [bacterium]